MKTPLRSPNDSRVFWGCFFAMVTCAFGFIIRTQVIDAWQVQFNLSETEKGEILGVGFWPFAFSIFILSLIIDRIGYRSAAMIGLALHLASTAVLLTAHSARALYWGTFLFALSNGTVEAYINPTISAMYPREKVKWLNFLHAGWPGGMVLAGVIGISLGIVDWRVKVALTLIPTAVYAIILIGTHFPVSERVAAGVTYREMLSDFGALGAFVAVYLISLQVCDGILGIETGKFVWPLLPAVVVAAAFGVYVRSLGRGVYFILLLIMIPLATTELGVDSWITDLMGPEMRHIGLHAGWVLVYTAAIMTFLRLNAGFFSHRFSPFAILAGGATLAALGLMSLSYAVGIGVLLAATIYGLGKAYFWSTTIGVVGDQFPKGGALTMNSIGGVGMLGLSVGMVFLGNVQDRRIDRELLAHDAASGTTLHTDYLTIAKHSIFGNYLALDQDALNKAPVRDLQQIEAITVVAKKGALRTAAMFPTAMLCAYIALLFYYKARGGYRVHVLAPSVASSA
jgi:MFS family permease